MCGHTHTHTRTHTHVHTHTHTHSHRHTEEGRQMNGALPDNEWRNSSLTPSLWNSCGGREPPGAATVSRGPLLGGRGGGSHRTAEFCIDRRHAIEPSSSRLALFFAFTTLGWHCWTTSLQFEAPVQTAYNLAVIPGGWLAKSRPVHCKRRMAAQRNIKSRGVIINFVCVCVCARAFVGWGGYNVPLLKLISVLAFPEDKNRLMNSPLITYIAKPITGGLGAFRETAAASACAYRQISGFPCTARTGEAKMCATNTSRPFWQLGKPVSRHCNFPDTSRRN